MTELEKLCVEMFRDIMLQDLNESEKVIVNYLIKKSLLYIQEDCGDYIVRQF